LHYTPQRRARRGIDRAAGTSQAQTLHNASGVSLYQTGNFYATGTVQNAGTYVPGAGTLLTKSGDASAPEYALAHVANYEIIAY
jgi:hypothetical protein